MKHAMSKLTLAMLIAAPAATAFAADMKKDSVYNPVQQSQHAASKKDRTSDTWLEAKLATTIALNRHVSIFDIDTDVRNQTAYLTGVVDSDIDKDLAGELAMSIEGIEDVENNITVDKTKAKEAKNRREKSEEYGFMQKVDDLTTTASIKSKLLVNSNVSGTDVNVDTTAGRVTLKGKVDSSKEKALIEQIAQNTSGVRSVNNQIRVQ